MKIFQNFSIAKVENLCWKIFKVCSENEDLKVFSIRKDLASRNLQVIPSPGSINYPRKERKMQVENAKTLS